MKPLRVAEFLLLNLNFAAIVFSMKSEHQRIWERPRLTAEIFQIFDFKADFFKNLSVVRVPIRLARLNEARQNAIKIGACIGVLGEQNVLAFVDAHND